MQAVLEEFAKRGTELNGYLSMLKELDKTGSRIVSANGRDQVEVADEWRRVAKATAYLMIYNLVESSIRSAFMHIYGAMEADGCNLQQASNRLRAVWIGHHHSRIDRDSSPPSKYKEVAHEMVKAALANEVLRLQQSKLPISGNLDADAIRGLCHDHGVSVIVPKSAKGGEVLGDVKEQRNALAHGDRSFSECGREVTVSDLTRTAKQATAFLHAILRNIKGFVERRAYRSESPVAV